jgi:hypothetical protein
VIFEELVFNFNNNIHQGITNAINVILLTHRNSVSDLEISRLRAQNYINYRAWGS